MYDGKEVRTLATHDQSETLFANEILNEVPKTIQNLNNLSILLSNILTEKELKQLQQWNTSHKPRNWREEISDF